MKNSLFDSLILVNLCVFPSDFSICFEKRPCMAIYIEKMGGWNDSRTMWDLFQTSIFNAENLPFIVLRTLHAHTFLYLYMHASWPCASCFLCAQAESFLDLYFSKINLFAHKNLYLSF